MTKGGEEVACVHEGCRKLEMIISDLFQITNCGKSEQHQVLKELELMHLRPEYKDNDVRQRRCKAKCKKYEDKQHSNKLRTFSESNEPSKFCKHL